MTDRDDNQVAPVTSRRAVLMGAGALGAVGVLTACGTDTPSTPSSSGGSTGSTGSMGSTGSTAGATVPSTSASEASSGSGGIKAADIPVGGGTIFAGQKVVVTQPTAGSYKAFSAVCTHGGCLVTTVQSGKIGCPCHGSEFSITDGSVAKGPATKALAMKTVTPSGDNLTVA